MRATRILLWATAIALVGVAAASGANALVSPIGQTSNPVSANDVLAPQNVAYVEEVELPSIDLTEPAEIPAEVPEAPQALTVTLENGEIFTILPPATPAEAASRVQALFPGCLKSPPEASPTVYFPDGSLKTAYTCVPYAPIPGHLDLIVMVERGTHFNVNCPACS